MSFKNYLARKLSIQKSRLSHILLTTHLPHTKRLSQVFLHHILHKDDQLPPKVDLRPDMTPVEDQLSIGSSVANCLAGSYEYLTKKSNGCNTDVSRLFIYYNARVKDNNSKSIVDSGCSMTDAIEALEEFGTCLESIWPYDLSNVNIRPDDQAYQQAANHKINKALQINIDLNEMKSCLAQGFPFAFGLRLYSSFDKAAKNGIVPIPSMWKKDQQSIGSHAMLAVGYSDRSNAFIVRNSWGEDWGDKGYCYIPYDYMTNPDLCFDVWTIRKVANTDFGREYWHFDDLVNYLNDCTIETISENNEEEYNQTNSRDYYYNRKNVIDESWDQYRHYEGNHFPRKDEEYFDNRYRRDRYDRDNEPFNQQSAGYINNISQSDRNVSYSFYDRYQDEYNHYRNSNDDRFTNNHRKSTF